MSYELFKQGPATYVPVLLISLLITLVAYGAFPLIFARTRKAVISRKKYNLICFGFNFLVLILFIVLNGSSSAGPYALWTWVFSASGLRTLEERGVLEGSQPKNPVSPAPSETALFHEAPVSAETEKELSVPGGQPRSRFCRRCGFELIEGSKFCSNCGAEIANED